MHICCNVYVNSHHPTGMRSKSRNKEGWHSRLAGLVVLGVFSSAGWQTAKAQTQTAVGVARASEALIKIYDPLVRNVPLVVPAAAGTPTACGTSSNNGDWEAYYCRNDHTILISQKNLDLVERKYGLEAIATLVAHEYAHGHQHALTGFSQDLVWSVVLDELQADCIAGVYMRDATPIQLTARQFEKSRNFLMSIGDYSLQERTWHGTPELRGVAFSHGYKSGSLSSCAASKDVNWRRLINDAPRNIDKIIEAAPEHIDKIFRKGLDFFNKL